MNTTVAGLPVRAREFTDARIAESSIPWYLWSSVLATACISGGLYWDISWHMTIGRDTFWTPAHLLIQFGAILAGLSSAYLILKATFAGDLGAKQSSVQIFGFSGPLGAFISVWGAAAMVISAPFDNWWHNAYGLDVKIISPPHQVLGFGIEGIGFGGIILIVGALNRAEGTLRKHLEWLLLALGGLIVTHSMMGRLEYTDRAMMHSSFMYLALAIGPPFILEAFARPAGMRWGRTVVSAIYTVFFLLTLWIFPLFPGEPKLGPVYQRVAHMVPLAFPILIIAPAIVLDWLWPKLDRLWPKPSFATKWLEAAITGVVFLVALIAAQWPFADFMTTAASGNWFFGTQYHPYMVPSEWPGVSGGFMKAQSAYSFWLLMGWAVAASIVSTRLGIAFGNWMRKVQR
ncbi:MAG TPA: hypothetical protein VKW06_22530 [Candidatus Angelobacter sp.]|nr:hypothetical protein [Candidatus Angelobacter sp.]